MDITNYLLIAIVGFIAQFVDGTLGMGYGVSSSTALISLGFYPVIVSASVHTAEVFTSLSSGISHLKFGNVRKNIFLPLTFFGIIGGIIGAYGLVNLPVKLVRVVVSSLLLILGCIILHKSINGKLVHGKEKFHPKRLSPFGLLGGFIDAIGGGGWGPVCTPILMMNGTEPRKVIGSVNLAEFFVTLSITTTFVLLIGIEKFRWDIVLPLATAGFIAAPFAAFMCKKLSPKILGTMIALTIILLNLRVLIKIF